jgi:phosphotransferase system HPr (HPr) family protein
MTKKTLVYKGEIPFHIRMIGRFKNIVKESGCDVRIEKNGMSVSGDKAMQILKLEIVNGDEVGIEVNGEKEEDVLSSLVEVLAESGNQ